MINPHTELTDLDTFESVIDKLDINPYIYDVIKLVLFNCWWSGYEASYKNKVRSNI